MKQLNLTEKEEEMVALALKNHLNQIEKVINNPSRFFDDSGLKEKHKICSNLMKNFKYEESYDTI